MTWNGRGLSQWRCTCGAARRVPRLFRIYADGLLRVIECDPCKRCGRTAPPTCSGDPWLDVGGGA